MYLKDAELKRYFNQIKDIFKFITHIREHLDIVFVFGQGEQVVQNTTKQKKSSLDKIKTFICRHNTKLATHISNRTKFFKYLENEVSTPFKFITIEALYKDLKKFSPKGVKTKNIELADLEYIAIKNSYSIVIFPESPGSFAELGYFSAKDDTRNKIIVSNSIQFYSQESYVNSIINLIYAQKGHKPILIHDNECVEHFAQCINQLMDGYTLSTYYDDVYKAVVTAETNYMYPVGVIYELIKIFPYLTFGELKLLVNVAFKHLKMKQDSNTNLDMYLSAIVSLLVQSELICRKKINNDEIIFKVTDDNFSCFKFNVFEEKLSRIIISVEFAIRNKKGIV